jgi:sec-independent protein translocase protein TatA
MPNIGGMELVVVLLIVLVLFGAGKLAGVGGALGTSIREFREGMEGKGKGKDESTPDKGDEAKPS